jgi:AcrR family transcriptional regulator
MVEVVSERGYPETRVVDVIEVAGVSRKTFYELFDGKEQCFLTTYDSLLGSVYADTSEGFESLPGAPWVERAGAGLSALLEHLAAHPSAARFAIVEVLAAGPKALSRRDAALRQFTGLIESGRAETSIELPGGRRRSASGCGWRRSASSNVSVPEKRSLSAVTGLCWRGGSGLRISGSW